MAPNDALIGIDRFIPMAISPEAKSGSTTAIINATSFPLREIVGFEIVSFEQLIGAVDFAQNRLITLSCKRTLACTCVYVCNI